MPDMEDEVPPPEDMPDPGDDRVEQGADFEDPDEDLLTGDTALEVLPTDPQIDLNSFATNVGTLIEMAEHKLDFKNPIANIAVAYLSEHYDTKLAKKFVGKLAELGFTVKISEESTGEEEEPEEKQEE